MSQREIPQPGQIWLHFKGTYYRILALGKHSETGEDMVVYRKRDGNPSLDDVWIRPLVDFLSVNHDGIPRFVFKSELA